MDVSQTMTGFATYEQAVRYLFDRTDYERLARVRHHSASYTLDRMRRLCEELGRPDRAFVSAHVAGTKGKGSVTTMTAHLLAGAGLRAGLYTSPHLADIRERIALLPPGGARCEPISPDAFVAVMGRMLPAIERLASGEHPTFFELMTAMAFEYFASARVDVAALEVGLGGRLDATNVVTPRVCAITSIGMDHTQVLGETIEQIAAEKAGIIKPGVPVVSAPQPASVERIIRETANRLGSPVRFVGREIITKARLVNHRWPRRWEVTVRTPGRTFEPMICPLLGRHQSDNLAVALGLVDQLIESGVPVNLAGLAAGLAQTAWPGRLEVRGRRPWVVLDGAHTVESMQAVLATLPETFNYRRLIVVAGCLGDKDLAGLMGQLANGSAAVVLTRSDHPQAADPADLADLLGIRAPHVARHIEPDAAAAVDLACRLASPDDLVLVTGSIYLVGLVTKLLDRV